VFHLGHGEKVGVSGLQKEEEEVVAKGGG